MTETMKVTETIQRVGYTIVDDVKIAQHTCTIVSDDPSAMRIAMVKLNPELYKEHRVVCRDNHAVFEDAAYALQEELIASMEAGE